MRRDLEQTPIHRSLLQPVLLFGIEREVVIALVGIASILLFAFRLNLVTPALAALVVFVGLPAARRVNRRDPWAWRIVFRHVRIARFYPAQARHDVPRRHLAARF